MSTESIPECKLQELVDTHIQAVHQSIKDGTKDFCPTLLVESIEPEKSETERQLDVIVIPELNETRFEVFEQLGQKYYKDKRVPLGIAFAAEAWTSSSTHCRPSESDDRKEIIFIAAKTLKGKAILQHMPLKRDKDGNMIESAFIERSDGESHTFLLDHFFRGWLDCAMGSIKPFDNLRS